MLRGLYAVLALALAGGAAASACHSEESIGFSGGVGGACAITAECSGFTCGAGPSCCNSGFGSVVCTPGATQPCSFLPAGSADARCVMGKQTCTPHGDAFDRCDEVLSRPEGCGPDTSWTCDATPAKCGDASWAVALGGSGTESAHSIALDGVGNVVVAGVASAGVLNVSGSGLSLPDGGGFVAKLDPTGVPIWGVALDGAATALVAIDAAGSIYVTGSVEIELKVAGHSFVARPRFEKSPTSTGYLIKLGPAGQFVWGKLLHGRKSLEATTVVTTQGAVIVAGSYLGLSADFGPTKLAGSHVADGFVASFDPSTGDANWATELGGLGDSVVAAIAIGSDGVISLAGEGASAEPQGPACVPHALLGALNPDGSKRFMNEAIDLPVTVRALAVDGDQFVVAGHVNIGFQDGGVSFVPEGGYLGFVDANGAEVWSRSLPFDGNAITFDSDHLIVVGGADDRGHASVMKLDSTGRVYYTHTYTADPRPGSKFSTIGIFGVAPGSDGAVFIAGGVRGTASLGLGLSPHDVSSMTKVDPFIARLEP